MGIWKRALPSSDQLAIQPTDLYIKTTNTGSPLSMGIGFFSP